MFQDELKIESAVMNCKKHYTHTHTYSHKFIQRYMKFCC